MSNPFDQLDLGNLYAGNGAAAAAPAPGDDKQDPTAVGGAPAPMMGGGAPMGGAPMGLGVPAPAPTSDPFASMGAPPPVPLAMGAPPPVPTAASPPAMAPPPVPAADDPWGAPASPPAVSTAPSGSLVGHGAEPATAAFAAAVTPAPVAGVSASTVANPFGAPAVASPGALVPSAVPNADPFGVGAGAPMAASPGAMVPAANPSDDPFGIFAGAAPPAAPASPVAPMTPSRAASPPPGAIVPSGGGNIYASPPSSPGHQPHPDFVPGYDYPDSPQPAAPMGGEGGDDDFWATMGLAPAPPPVAERVPVGASPAHGTTDAAPQAPQAPEGAGAGDAANGDGPPPVQASASGESLTMTEDGLPAGGEKYAARVQAPSLGVIFFTAAELLPSVFCEIRSSGPIRALETRPVVGHCFASSAALAAGIMPGHVLLSVNGKKVMDPAEAKAAIKESPRPLQLECYILPEAIYPCANSEGAHMVKYDTNEEGAPASQWEWKPKYVVIGGIIAKPWMIMMYRNRAEYDTAVKTVMADRSPKVKIKQFSLLGAHIYCDEQGPLEYHPTNHKHRYFSIIPRRGYPIKISARTPEDIVAVHSGARRVLARHNSGGYDERLSAGERNMSALDMKQTPWPRDKAEPKRADRMSFYERPQNVQTVGSY